MTTAPFFPPPGLPSRGPEKLCPYQAFSAWLIGESLIIQSVFSTGEKGSHEPFFESRGVESSVRSEAWGSPPAGPSFS